VLPADGQTIDADWISVLRFDLPEATDVALLDWLQGDARRILVAHGVKRLRYGTRLAENVGAGSFRPRCVIFAEWPVRPPEAADLLPPLVQRFDPSVTGAENFIGWRAYPWPDVKRA
jgi:hypothetical protein